MTNDTKQPREWWIFDGEPEGFMSEADRNKESLQNKNIDAELIHAIEKSAYLAVCAERDRAYKKYANIELANKNLTRNDHATFGELLMQVSALKERLSDASDRITELVGKLNHCIHPGCCCVCGHKGKCPEDGPCATGGVM